MLLSLPPPNRRDHLAVERSAIAAPGGRLIVSGGMGDGFVKHLTQGWQVAPIISLNSGQPFTVTSGADTSLTGIKADRPNIDPTVASTPHTLANWFDQDAFVGACTNKSYTGNPYCVANGTFGNASRDILSGPGSIQFDMSATRRFSFNERYKMELRGDFFNIMNHANWNSPATGMTSSTFGQITGFSGPRLIQVSAKFLF